MIVIDMDMPKNCSSCELSNINACPIFHRNAAESVKGRLNDCPIKCDIEDIKANILFMAEKCLPNCTAEEYEVKGLKEALNIINKHTK